MLELPPLSLPSLPSIKASLIVNTPILTIILVVALIIYSIVSAILVYHWSSYGMRAASVLFAEALFLIVSVTLFVISGLAINYF